MIKIFANLLQKLVPPIVSINAKHYPNGYYLTRIPFDSSWLPDQWDNSLHYNYTKPSPGPHCFPYWIASIRSGRLKYTNCLKIQPTWMNDNKYIVILLPKCLDFIRFELNQSNTMQFLAGFLSLRGV